MSDDDTPGWAKVVGALTGAGVLGVLVGGILLVAGLIWLAAVAVWRVIL